MEITPPDSRSLEAGLVAGLLVHTTAIPQVEIRLIPSDMQDPIYRWCYQEITRRFEDGKPVEIIEMAHELEHQMGIGVYPEHKEGVTERVHEALNAVSQAVSVSADGTVSIAEKIADIANRRRIIAKAQTVVRSACDLDVPVESVLAALERIVSDPLLERDETPEVVGQVLTRFTREQKAFLEEGEGSGITTGIKWLDTRLHLRRGAVLLLGAKTKIGKTWLMQQLALSCDEQKYKVGWLSTEMDHTDVASRILGAKGGLSWALKRPPKSLEEVAELEAVAANLAHSSIRFRYERDAAMVLRRLHYWKRTDGLDVAIIDYFQDLKCLKEWGDKWEGQAYMIRELKDFAKRQQVLVIVVSSLKKGDKDAEKRGIRTSDLAGSTTIPYTADYIMLMDRPSKERRHKEIIECHLPESRLVPDGKGWFLLRDTQTLEYIELPKEEADRLLYGSEN